MQLRIGEVFHDTVRLSNCVVSVPGEDPGTLSSSSFALHLTSRPVSWARAWINERSCLITFDTPNEKCLDKLICLTVRRSIDV